MKDMRIFGNMIEKLTLEKNDTSQKLGELLGCPEEQILALYKGLIFPSFEQLDQLATHFEVTIDEILSGDEAYYKQNVVHNMGQFEDSENREKILDIIDDYLSLKSAVIS